MMDSAVIGDRVWVARAGTTQMERPCRVCDGRLRVTLILGSGEQVAVECAYCSRGFEGSVGVEPYYAWEATAAHYTVTGIEVLRNEQGEVVRYQSGGARAYTTFDAADCYATYDDAVASGARLVAQHEAEQEEQMSRKEKDRRSYSWNAGYHLREAEKARKQVLYHDRKAESMKAQTPGAAK